VLNIGLRSTPQGLPIDTELQIFVHYSVYATAVRRDSIDLTKVAVGVGMFIGGVVLFLTAAIPMTSVG
jgi:hypothetical protein